MLPDSAAMPYVKYADHRTACRRALRKAQITGIRDDWTACSRISAAFRRHTNRLHEDSGASSGLGSVLSAKREGGGGALMPPFLLQSYVRINGVVLSPPSSSPRGSNSK